MPLHLAPGESIRRVELHRRYGGRQQGGISPSGQTPHVFIITAPDQGKKYGYIYDGQNEDGYYHYTGEGQKGDQLMAQGNRAIRDHVAEGRELHLFTAHGSELTYVGPFQYINHYAADAPEVKDPGSDAEPPIRKVIVFRLEQRDGVKPPSSEAVLQPSSGTTVVEIPVEQQLTKAMLIDRDNEPYEAKRREQALVHRFREWLEQQDHEICRLQIKPDGESAALYCDAYDKTTNTLYEAKGSVARPAIRMAIGQLADYCRLLDPRPKKVLLVPERPRHDLMALLELEDISVCWPEQGDFVSSDS